MDNLDRRREWSGLKVRSFNNKRDLDDEVRGWDDRDTDVFSLVKSTSVKGISSSSPFVPKKTSSHPPLHPLINRSGSVPLLGIGFQAGDPPPKQTVLPEADAVLTMSTGSSLLSAKTVVRELQPAKAVTLEVAREWKGRAPLKVLRKTQSKKVDREESRESAHLSMSLGDGEMRREVGRDFHLENTVPPRVYRSEKLIVKRELAPPPHSTDLAQTLSLSFSHAESIAPKLPALKAKKAAARPSRPDFSHSLAPSDPYKLSVLRNAIDAAHIKHSVPYVELIHSDYPKYRIPIDYNIYRNVRKYALRRSVITVNQSLAH